MTECLPLTQMLQNKDVAAYARIDRFKKRRNLKERWSSLLDNNNSEVQFA